MLIVFTSINVNRSDNFNTHSKTLFNTINNTVCIVVLEMSRHVLLEFVFIYGVNVQIRLLFKNGLLQIVLSKNCS